jgi:hypothetical protein
VAIAIQNPEQFRRLLVALANEIVDANIYWKLHKDLQIAAATFQTEVNQAPAFWSLTLQAHLDAAVFRLCKIYDQHRDGLNLQSLLQTIQANAHVFSEENFRARLAGNPFVDSLAAEARAPDMTQLATDLAYVSKNTNAKVQVLVDLRNKFYAHRASRDVVAATDFATEYPLTKGDVTELLTTALEIVNRYSNLFHAQSYSSQMVGRDDYRTVIDAVHWDLKRRDSELHRAGIRRDLNAAWEEAKAKARDSGEGD